LFAATVGIDADPDMIAHAAQRAARAHSVSWRQLRAEDLPADLGSFRVVTFAQSFHWMDQHRVARAVRPMITPGGAWVHVGATTHQGVPGDVPLPYPRPHAIQVASVGTSRSGRNGSRPPLGATLTAKR
jgi:hypothetical protein